MIQAVPEMVATLAKDALNHPHDREWSVQGFGMLRAYLDPDREWRLHVWHGAHRVPEVTIIHDHPWAFESHVLVGAIANQRYDVRPFDEGAGARPTHWETKILCGEEACVMDDERRPVRLAPRPLEFYLGAGWAGPFPSAYGQEASEVHESHYLDGTVTLIRREFTREDRDHALVYVPDFREWVDATPRTATQDEVGDFVDAARALYARGY